MRSNEFLPRDGRFLLEGIPWLARMIDKGRASLSGSLGDYEFPCSMDERLLEFLGLDAVAFLDLLRTSPADLDVIRALGISRREPTAKKPWSDVFLIRYSRLLDSQENEEHRNDPA